MDRNETFPALNLTGLEVNMAWGSLEVGVTNGSDFQILIAGDDNSCENMRAEVEKGILLIEQPALGLTYKINQPMWLQVSVLIPAQWKGSVDLSTVSGRLSVETVSGSDIKLESVSGNIRAGNVNGITVKLITVSGDIDISGVDCDTCTLRTVSGDFRLNSGAASVWKLTAASGDMTLNLTQPLEKLNGSSVSGNVFISVPLDKVDAHVRSVSGRIRTNRIFITDDAPKITMSTVSGDLEITGNA